MKALLKKLGSKKKGEPAERELVNVAPAAAAAAERAGPAPAPAVPAALAAAQRQPAPAAAAAPSQQWQAQAPREPAPAAAAAATSAGPPPAASPTAAAAEPASQPPAAAATAAAIATAAAAAAAGGHPEAVDYSHEPGLDGEGGCYDFGAGVLELGGESPPALPSASASANSEAGAAELGPGGHDDEGGLDVGFGGDAGSGGLEGDLAHHVDSLGLHEDMEEDPRSSGLVGRHHSSLAPALLCSQPGCSPAAEAEGGLGLGAEAAAGDESEPGGDGGSSGAEAAAGDAAMGGPAGTGEASGSGGGAGEGTPLSDPLATMVYLTEEEEVGGDAISVLSDAMTEEELAEELSELEQALSALEGEALYGGSPGASSQLDKDLAERLGLGPDDSGDPSAYAKSMVKLYTELGLKLMDSRKFDDALTMMRKAEALVENDAMWPASTTPKRKRLQSITYNNLGCLFKRRNHPQQALQYLMRALALEEETGHVQNSSSTHLNICAAYSSLKKYRESLAHAERAILLLQRQLWALGVSFQEGLQQLCKTMATAPDRRLLMGVNVLGIAYHNAGLEHERLGRLREAHVCFTRAATLATRCLGPRSALTASLQRALKVFCSRHQQAGRGRSPAGTPRAGPVGAQVKGRHASPKRVGSRVGGGRPPSGARLHTTSRSSLAAASAKGVLPLDKGRAFGKEARSASTGKLAEHARR